MVVVGVAPSDGVGAKVGVRVEVWISVGVGFEYE